MEDKKGVSGVDIENVHTSIKVSTNEKGAFLIAATNGQLLEFQRQGYKTVRVRIPQGDIPPYFRIIMKKGVTDMPGGNLVKSDRYDYKADSIRFHELYKHELDFPKMSAIDMIASPFSALSSKNRAIWAFQEDYAEFEKEKYIDRTFNENVIMKYTGLKGDSLHYYMRRYRPSYEQLRSMTDYAFYNYIRESVKHYRNVNTPRNSQ
jgi:hypothetical protein